MTIVDHGFALAVKKLGTIGVQVKIIPPGARLPDTFEVLEPQPEVPEEPVYEGVDIDEDIIGAEIDAELEAAEDVPVQEEL